MTFPPAHLLNTANVLIIEEALTNAQPVKGDSTMRPVERAFIERRTGKDRRRFYSIKRFFYGKRDRRSSRERRSTREMRANWIRVSRWSSAPLQRLKISKYILK